jgi:signal recognition particle subunit SRP19
MGYRKDNKYVIYPLYFDQSISRKDGRRVPTKLSCEKPSITEIAKVAKNLGFNPQIEEEAGHPRRSWKKDGRILIDKKEAKQSIILRIAKSL